MCVYSHMHFMKKQEKSALAFSKPHKTLKKSRTPFMDSTYPYAFKRLEFVQKTLHIALLKYGPQTLSERQILSLLLMNLD